MDVLRDTLRMETFLGTSLTEIERGEKTYFLHRYAGRSFYLERSSGISPEMVGRLVRDIVEAWPRPYASWPDILGHIESRLVSPNSTPHSNYESNYESILAEPTLHLSQEQVARIAREIRGETEPMAFSPEKLEEEIEEPSHPPTAYERLVSDDD